METVDYPSLRELSKKPSRMTKLVKRCRQDAKLLKQTELRWKAGGIHQQCFCAQRGFKQLLDQLEPMPLHQ